MRSLNDDAKLIQEQHDKHMEERDEENGEKERLEEKLVTKKSDLDEILGTIKEKEAHISKIGGGFASKRGELKIKKSEVQAKISFLEIELRSKLSGPLPFCLIPKPLKQLKSQIKKDQKILKTQFEKEIIDEKLNELKSTKENLWNGVNTDSKTKEQIIQNISKLLSPKESTKDSSMFNFSTLMYDEILSIIDNLKTNYLSSLEERSQEFSILSDELQRLDVALVNAPNDDELGPLINELNQMHKEKGILETEINHLESKISKKISYINMLNFKLRNILGDKYKNKNAGTQAELAVKVQKVLDQYVEKLKIRKLKLLEQYLLEEVQRLMHKDNLITKVTVDKKTFEIILYDKDENEFPKDLLSKGEKQMYATAVLLALAKTSGKPLPFMIDTPLARLDIGHRDNLIDKFFPYASHQVVIFSTDSEIDEKYFPKMKPYLSRSYAMEFVPGEGRTKQHSGYFWNDSGEKTIAI